MEVIAIMAFFAFLTLGTSLIVKAYFPIIQNLALRKQKNNKDTLVRDALNTLKNPKNIEEEASAFVDLMHLSYVSVHTLVNNQYDDYNDIVQSERFQSSLTPDMLTKLNALDVRY